MAVYQGLHRAVKAGKNSTTRVGGSNLEVPRVAEANNGRAEVVQEVDDKKGQQDSGPTYKAEDIGGRDRGIIQLVRDRELYNKSSKTTLQSPLYWAPYIYFSVQALPNIDLDFRCVIGKASQVPLYIVSYYRLKFQKM